METTVHGTQPTTHLLTVMHLLHCQLELKLLLALHIGCLTMYFQCMLTYHFVSRFPLVHQMLDVR